MAKETADVRTQGAGETRPPGPRRGLRETLELAQAGIPFRVRLWVVYALIAAALAGAFSFMDFDVQWMIEHARSIVICKTPDGIEWMCGLPLTLVVCISAIALATVLALIGALSRLSRSAILYGISGFYTSFFRGTPLIVQIFIIYFGLGEAGVRLRQAGYVGLSNIFILAAVPAGILALGLNYGAYMTEIFRAGIQSVGHGQTEAAYALGMTYRQVMRRVVLPQALRVIIPPTGNEFIAMLKDSALVSTIGVIEMFRRGDLTGRTDFRVFEAFILVAGVYWILTGIFTFFQSRLERRMSRGYVRAAAAPTKPRFVPASAGGGVGGGGMMVEIPEEKKEEG